MPDVALRNFPAMDRQHLEGGLVGFLSYDAVYDLWLDEVGRDRPDSRFPDAQFVLTTSTVRFDHVEDTVRSCSRRSSGKARTPASARRTGRRS